MDNFQTELTKDQREKLLHYTCQAAVIHNHLLDLEELVPLDSELQHQVITTGAAVHTVKVKLMNLVVD